MAKFMHEHQDRQDDDEGNGVVPQSVNYCHRFAHPRWPRPSVAAFTPRN
jgi:hypothetical protein